MGRPKSFDPDLVLDRAIGVFWEKGYEGASVDDLTRAMGINRFSMYSTFGDKHELFLKALDKHEREWRVCLSPRLEKIDSLDGLQGFFYENADAALAECGAKCGCVMVLTAVTRAGHDEESRSRVEEHLQHFVNALEEVLKRIDGAGELTDDVSTGEAARFLAVMGQGLVVSASGGQSRVMLRKSIRLAIDALRS